MKFNYKVIRASWTNLKKNPKKVAQLNKQKRKRNNSAYVRKETTKPDYRMHGLSIFYWQNVEILFIWTKALTCNQIELKLKKWNLFKKNWKNTERFQCHIQHSKTQRLSHIILALSLSACVTVTMLTILNISNVRTRINHFQISILAIHLFCHRNHITIGFFLTSLDNMTTYTNKKNCICDPHFFIAIITVHYVDKTQNDGWPNSM